MRAAGIKPVSRLSRASNAFRLALVAVAGLLCLAASVAEASPQQRSSSRRSRTRAQTQPTAERIKEIQTALTRAGYYSGEISGKWDSHTIAAMKRLQEANGLKATGKLNARSLQLLGLGSEIAGLSPPREPVATASAPE